MNTYILPKLLILFFINLGVLSVTAKPADKPNILFILMDDLGYGQFGLNNDTLKTSDFDPYFVHLVDSLQGYSHDKALEFTKTAIPTITKLAKNGILFTNAYASSNLCAPSRLGIATGTMQTRWGVYRNTDCEAHGIVPGTHLAEKLKAQHYKTAHIGKWHIGSKNRQVINDVYIKHGIDRKKIKSAELKKRYPDVVKAIQNCGFMGSVIDEHHPLNNGFDYYFGYNTWGSQFYNSTLVWENFNHAGIQKGYNTDVFTDKAMDFMKEQIDSNDPFYIQLHYHAVHDSLEHKAPDAYLNKFNSKSFTLNNFYAHLYGVDYNVKRIIDFLKSKGVYKNTMIVFTSDNGGMCGGTYQGHKTGSPLPGNAPFSGHKGNYQMGGIRVPMFVHWPAGIKKAAVSDQMVSTMDILPSAIDIAGGEVPQEIDGKSLVPLFRNPESTQIHDHLVWAGIHSNKWGYLINKTTKTYKSEDDFAPAAWVVRRGDYLLRFTGKRAPGVYTDYMEGRDAVMELFNIRKDPKELNDLAPNMPEKVQEMSKIYFKESKDFPAPAKWNKEKWEELKVSEYLIR